jgi:pilus assembly protein CpaE
MKTDVMTVRLEVVDSRTNEELAEIIRSVEGWNLIESVPCNLLILEVGSDPERNFRRISQARASGEAEEIFLTARQPDPDVLIHALRAGVGEFFPQPLKREVVVEALLRVSRNRHGAKEAEERAEKGAVFTVFGAKGGVGTTTIAVNLATGLARLDDNYSVALIDMNILSGEIPLFLNMKSTFNWAEVARNISRLDATYLMSLLQRHASGVHVLPAPVRLTDEIGAAPEIEKVLELMHSMFDFLVIDCGQSMGSISRYPIEISDKALLVAIPSLPAVIRLKRLIEAFHDLGYPPEDIITVLNRYNQKSIISPAEVWETIKNDIRWNIPNDYRNTMRAINSGEPLTATAPNAEATKKILELAASLSGKKHGANKGKRAFLGMFLKEAS